MAFINQFPYSDFHELNLDWLIKVTKENQDKIAYLDEEFSKIEILTEEYIEQMINQAIAANNVNVYRDILQVREDLTAAITALDINLTA